MSKRLDYETYCSSLVTMIDALRPFHKDQETDVMKFSYILSLQNYIES